MKNLYLLFLLPAVVIITSPANAQEWKKPFELGGKYVGGNLHSISFADSLNGWAVGDNRLLMATNDGGETWSNQNHLEINNLRSVHFYNEDIGWAAGGKIISTIDGGETWTVQHSLSSRFIYSMQFIDRYRGWAVGYGGLILATDDGGETWTEQLGFPIFQTFYSVHFLDSERGWAVGERGGKFTKDGGENWENIKISDLITCRSVHFLDSNKGWLVLDNGDLMVTTDGGENWSLHDPTTGNNLRSIYFTDPDNGWAIGNSGRVLTTNDGGENWTTTNSGTNRALNSIHVTDENTAWIAGNGGVILTTTDGGENWVQKIGGSHSNFIAVHFTDSLNGRIATRNTSILETSDGGKNWTANRVNIAGGGPWIACDLQHGDYIWCMESNGDIIYTKDDCESYNVVRNNLTISPRHIYFADSLHGWVVEDFGLIIASTDGGETWTTQFDELPHLFFAPVHFTDKNNGWAVGGSGYILRTEDGGENWKIATSATVNYLLSVYFIDSKTGWAVGEYGTIITTDDGGRNWRLQNSGVFDVLGSVFFVDEKHGWAAGEFGTIINTTDGGETWTTQNSGTSNNILDIYFTDIKTGWAFTQGGEILLHTEYPCTGTTLTLTSSSDTDSQTVELETPISYITYELGGLATGAEVTGLPLGVNGTLNGNEFIISGSPGETGVFNYTVTTTGTANPCEEAVVTGSIVVEEPSADGDREEIRLSQNSPNPFDKSTTIDFYIPESATVSLLITDLNGITVKKIVRRFDAGDNEITIKPVIPAGTYIYQLSTPFGDLSRPMIVH